MDSIGHNSPAGLARALLLSFLLLTLWPQQICALSPSDLIIVYNLKMKQSKAVATYYAKKRSVPLSNLVGVDVTKAEKMDPSDFEKRLVPQVQAMVERLRTEGKDPAILLVYGIPLVVKNRSDAKPDKTFMALVERKVDEYKKLVVQLSGELDRFVGKADLTPKPTNSNGTSATKDVLKMAEESFTRGVQYLGGPQTDRKDEKRIRAGIASLLMRLGGTSVAAKAFVERVSKQQEKARELFLSQEILTWHAILRSELDENSLSGVLPEDALQTATTVRIVHGLLGELRFWEELKIFYEDGTSSAAVDSELTLISAGPYPHAKWLPNPFHSRYENLPFIKNVRAKRIKVGRVDGPTPELAKRLVDDALATEEVGLKGIFYIDARGLTNKDARDSYAWYDQHLVNLYNILKEKASMEVIMDERPTLFPVGACPNAALYCGWYSLGNYVDSFKWQKGAVGFHIASGEASTLRKRDSNVWCKRMIEQGVAATLGPVQEPYLLSFPLPDHFFPLLMTGEMPLLDVYFQTTPFISWRQILIGDPLYTPFKKEPAINLPKTPKVELPQTKTP
jgi:uncharacterized protein (TIGR03790 family)